MNDNDKLIKQDLNFNAWVESLPAESWIKKDLSACRMGWDAALEYAAKKDGAINEKYKKK